MISRRLVVVTDLDGTLLDQESYGYGASLPAVRELREREIPLVLCSSKTRSEIVVLWRELELRDPFISENGGAVYFLPDYFPFAVDKAIPKDGLAALELGADIATVRRALGEAAIEAGVMVRSFGSMSASEVSRLTGLGAEQAVLARQREYDEPFVIEGGDREVLLGLLRRRGFTVTYGGRLFHVARGHDKGKAVRLLLEQYHRRDPDVTSVGLGNSANDLPLLKEVDVPVVVKNTDGSHDPEILLSLSAVLRTKGIGPEGWCEAIRRILAGPR
jgi:mannosyl-3-phosphoglycerate phosphatase